MKGTFFYITITGIFILIICHSWFSDGMFMDGTIYAVLSRNMANGTGTFWQPHFSDTMFPVFVEHPPLAFGIEGILFRIFGDNRFVERFYSMFTIFITAIIMVLIWKTVLKKTSTGWLPLLFWITMPTVNWISVNHMLENTLAIFICLSVLFYFKSLSSRRILYIFLSGSMLSLGFLTKGFVTFTPLSLPFFYWLFMRKRRFFSMAADSSLLLLSAILPLIILYFFTGAHEFLPKYIDMALFKITEGETADSRYYILYRLIMEIIPSVALIILFIFFRTLKKQSVNISNESTLLSLVFFSLGMAGILPILTTMDQSTYFLYLSLPFFALSFAFIVNPYLEPLIEKINYKSSGFRLFKIFGVVTISAGFFLSVYFSKEINRDKNMIMDMRMILPHLEESSTISILPDMRQNYSLFTYYARYKDVSLDIDMNNMHEYLLIATSLYSDTINKHYEKINLDTKEYALYRRKSSDSQK
ncbi:MAG: glycosyltransferase family 39 protein [Bacteroidia bacterium]|nr:glycosyltransferase family 39 protein [Bacteroidia bacterium]